MLIPTERILEPHRDSVLCRMKPRKINSSAKPTHRKQYSQTDGGKRRIFNFSDIKDKGGAGDKIGEDSCPKAVYMQNVFAQM